VGDEGKIRPRRSLLFAPATNPRALAKAQGLACDAVIVDLEDSVEPEAKAEARAAAAAALGAGFGGREAILRCNALDTPWGGEDLQAAARIGPDAVLVPKVRGAEDIRRCDAALQAAPARTRIWAMVETPAAVLNLGEIAALAASTRLGGLVLGLNDLTLEMRARRTPGRAGLLPVLTWTVLAARAHGLPAFDSVFNAIDDEAGLEAECRQAADLGFDGKTLIHPRQVGPCNLAFSPTGAEIAWARKVAAAFAAPEAQGAGVLKLDGRMVERLHLAEAERTLRLAELTPAAAP
jgi:citrate lyase subunit beta/citryl-CoA lyase